MSYVISYKIHKLKRMVIALLLSLCAFSAFSQDDLLPPDLWYNGEILLSDSSSVIGKLKYDFQGNNILLKSKGEVTAYTPKTFIKVHFSDTLGNEREFVILNIKNKKDFQIALFFERLVDGETKLYVREEVVYYSSSNMATQGFQSEMKKLLLYRYYFRKGDGQVYYFKASKHQVLKVLKLKKDLVKLYVKEHKLRYSSKADLINIFTYYNSLL